MMAFTSCTTSWLIINLMFVTNLYVSGEDEFTRSELETLREDVDIIKKLNKKQESTIEKQAQLIESLVDRIESLEAPEQVNLKRESRQTTETVGFTAYLGATTTVHSGNVIKFNQVLYNDGNAYNVFTGVFTAPITGTYVFSFQIEDYKRQDSRVYMKFDGMNTVDAILSTNGLQSIQSGNTAVLGLTAGQSVWVETGEEGRVYGDNAFRGTTFCGALVY